VHALHHLAHAGLDAGLVAQVGHVLATLADDDTGFLGRDDGAQGELGLGVLLIRLGGRLAVRAQARLIVAHLQAVHGVAEVCAIGRNCVLHRRHC